ncbi:MAG: hypothetical protein WDO15_08080 [Bacteroidota bacterium]
MAKNTVILNDHNRVLNADSKGDYVVKITDARGCTNTDKTVVINDCLPRLNAPNAFRPGSTVFNPDRKDLTNSDFWEPWRSLIEIELDRLVTTCKYYNQ